MILFRSLNLNYKTEVIEFNYKKKIRSLYLKIITKLMKKSIIYKITIIKINLTIIKVKAVNIIKAVDLNKILINRCNKYYYSI